MLTLWRKTRTSEGKTMRIGFIGLGNIGYPMAATLIKAGFELTVHDLVKEKAERLIKNGASWGATLRETVSGADTVITSLPGPAQVTEVFEAEDGLLESLASGQVWLEMSTSDKELITRYAEQLSEKQVTTMEATVTGGVDNAYEGNITVFVGGDKTTFESLGSVLDAVAGKVVYLGALGNATVVKLITNMLAFVHGAALVEGLLLGKRAGVETGPLLEAIQHSYAGSFVADLDGPKVLAGNYDSSFGIGLAIKDMRLSHQLGETLDVPLVFGGLATQTLIRARARYGEGADTLEMMKLIAEEIGERLHD